MQKTLDRPADRQAGIHTDIANITPEMAKAWLEKNTGNRAVSTHHLVGLARDMTAGQWRLTGEAIKFDTTGRLIDGQHRLMACVRSGSTFKSVVLYGIDPLAQDVLDGGKSRTANDVLSLRGLTNASRVGSALRALLSYKEEVYGKNHVVTKSDVVAAFERHPNITKSGAVLNLMPRGLGGRGITFLHYVATTLLDQQDAANRMVEVLKTGVPSYHGDPMHAFRERCVRGVSHGDKRLRAESVEHTLFYVWNLFVEERTVGVLRFQTQFVDIRGLDRSAL